MFSIVVCVVVGILVFLCGYFAGWVNCHSKIKVGAPSTSTNNARDEILQYLNMAISAINGNGPIIATGYIKQAIAKLHPLRKPLCEMSNALK